MKCMDGIQCASGNCEMPTEDAIYGVCKKYVPGLTVGKIVLIVLGCIVLSIIACVVCCCVCCKRRDRIIEKQLVVQEQYGGGYPGAQVSGYQPLPQQTTQIVGYQPVPQQTYQ